MKFTICPAFLSPQELTRIAVESEFCGFDVVAFVDHVAHPETLHTPYTFSEDGIRPWDETAVWPEPWTMMTHVAARTSTIELMTAVYVLPLRNPALVAQQVSTVSQLADAVLKWWVARSRMTLVDVARCRSSFVVGGGEVADESVRCCEAVEEFGCGRWRGSRCVD